MERGKKHRLEIKLLELEIKKRELEIENQKLDKQLKRLGLTRLAIQIPLTAALLITATVTALKLFY